MADNALLAALIGGGGGEAAASNPFLLAAPDIQIGQQMQQAGLSTAPAYPMQAFGRLAQALAGSVVRNQGISDLAKTYSHTAHDMAAKLRAVDPNNALLGVLESGDPFTQFQGVQTFPKVITGLGLPSDVGRGTVRATGVGAPNPYPLSGSGELALDTARMGGPKLTPIQAEGAKAATEKTAEETARANVEFGGLRGGQPQPQGPGFSEPMKSPTGTQIPALKEQAPIPSDPASLKEKIPAWQKTTTDWINSLAPSQLAEQRLMTIAGAFKAIQSGSWTTNLADWRAKLNTAGIHVADNVLPDPDKVQLALHENYAETLNQLKAATSRFTQQEFRITSENKEHPNIQPAANLQMLAEDIGSLRQGRDLVRDWSIAQHHGWRDPQSFEAQWLQQNKVGDYANSIRKEIGPLKGMSENGALPRYNSPEEVHAAVAAKKLNPGDKFLMPDGRIGTAPNAAR